MANAKFQVGQIVQLKSGGPDMTVSEVNESGPRRTTVWCQWFGGRKLERGLFDVEALVAAETGTEKPKK